MCSVFGYIGKNNCRSYVMEGLQKLEYRGYDSAGFACLDSDDKRLYFSKAKGRLKNLATLLKEKPMDGHIGIGHTRWSVYGKPSQKNAHPHFDCEKRISIVHNGIIENYHSLKEQLTQAGHIFHSETDTETIAHLFESLLVSHKTLKAAVVDLVNQLEGAYAFLCINQDYPDCMIMVRKRSPLCIGIGDDEIFVASDPLAFINQTKKVLFLPDESFAIVKKDLIELYEFSGKPLTPDVQELSIEWQDNQKNEHQHYMLKEIYEQKNVIHATVDFLHAMTDQIWDHLSLTLEQVRKLDKIHLVGCGTSWHAARIAQFYFETICMIPTRVHLASEFRYMPFFPDEDSLYVYISQSGETADTLEALRLVNSMNLPTITVTNVPSSTMVREAGGFLLTQAGQEIAVASTKAFSTQLSALYWLAHRIALEKRIIDSVQMEQAEQDLLVAAEVLENTIENYKRDICQTHAPFYTQFDRVIFLGRHLSYPLAMEAALKLKEISYIFSQCYPAGELKHGPLALVDEKTPVFIFSHSEPLIYQKIVSNAHETKARGGHVVAFAFEGQHELIDLADLSFVVPKVKTLLGPLAMIGIIQFFTYQIAKNLDCPIDKPRNLAKSVTVE